MTTNNDRPFAREYKVLKPFICDKKKSIITAGQIWERSGLITQYEKNKINLQYVELITSETKTKKSLSSTAELVKNKL